MSGARVWWEIGPDELVSVDPPNEQRELMVVALLEWGGATRPTDALARAMGFPDRDAISTEGHRLRAELRERRPWQDRLGTSPRRHRIRLCEFLLRRRRGLGGGLCVELTSEPCQCFEACDTHPWRSARPSRHGRGSERDALNPLQRQRCFLFRFSSEADLAPNIMSVGLYGPTPHNPTLVAHERSPAPHAKRMPCARDVHRRACALEKRSSASAKRSSHGGAGPGVACHDAPWQPRPGTCRARDARGRRSQGHSRERRAKPGADGPASGGPRAADHRARQPPRAPATRGPSAKPDH